MNSRQFACGLTIGLGLVSGCSDRKLALDDEPEDVEVLEPPPLSAWDCEPRIILQPDPAPTSVQYFVSIVDALRSDAVPELQVRACSALDGNCVNPVPMAVVTPDFARPASLRITLPYGFDGYLRLDAPGYATTMYYFGGPLFGGPDLSTIAELVTSFNAPTVATGRPIAMLNEATLEQIHVDLGLTPNLGTGTLMVLAVDCDDAPSDGVRLELDGAAVPWVMRNGLITRSDGVLPTDASGLGGFLEVTPGVVRIDGLVSDPCVGDDCRSSEPSWREAASIVTRVSPSAVTVLELRARETFRP